MPKETDIRRLEAKIVELENLLKAVTATKPVDLSAAEIRAYLKVRDAISIFDCVPGVFQCVPTKPCIVACRCGPCNIGYFGGGGLTRFTDLGS
jgi:hypothetical protein